MKPPTGALVDLSGDACWVAYLNGERVPGSIGWVSIANGWLERLVSGPNIVQRVRLHGRVELHHVVTGEVMR